MRTNIIMLVAGIAIGVALYANIAHLKPVSEAVSESNRGEASRGEMRGERPHCNIPERLPQWNELVLRMWGSDRITDDTFQKNFSIVGESGAKILKAQGYSNTIMNRLSNCLVTQFKARGINPE
jgi:hypothetical protein